MGSLIKIDTSLIEQVATGFISHAEQVRTAVAKVINQAPFAASAAIVAAKMVLVDSMTETDKAFLLSCIRTKDLLIEGGKPPSDDAVFSVVAEASAKGLLFGCAQYSVWTTGKLYIKEGGYRQLFLNRSDCSMLDVSPELPEWRVLKDKSMWVVPGTASVVVDGEIVTIEGVIGVNGNSTDTISKITAHAERALLIRLWKKVSSIDLEEHDGDQTEFVETSSPLAIEATTQSEPVPFTTQIEQATKSRELDVIARAIVAAKLPDDETEFYKTMVTEARQRISASEVPA